MDMGIDRIVFVSMFDYPSRYAHALHGLRMAEAFERAFGEKFLFLVNTVVVSGALGKARYVRLFGPFGRMVKKMRLRRLLAPASALWFLLSHGAWRGRGVALYVTDPVLYGTAVVSKFLFKTPMLAECHGTLTAFQTWCLSRADAAVFVTAGLRDDFLGKYPLRARATHVVPNAVDVDAFDAVPDDAAFLKNKLGLPDAFLVGYVGRFEPMGHDKGLRLMIRALAALPDVHVLLVGGTTHEAVTYRSFAKSVGAEAQTHIIGHVDYALVPEYAKACDALAYVPPVKNDFFEKHTSPMKLFEYMAAGRPIIASDTPTVREVVGDDAFFIPQGSVSAFCEAVQTLRRDPYSAGIRSEKARVRVRGNTWDTRARRVVHALQSVLS